MYSVSIIPPSGRNFNHFLRFFLLANKIPLSPPPKTLANISGIAPVAPPGQGNSSPASAQRSRKKTLTPSPKINARLLTHRIVYPPPIKQPANAPTSPPRVVQLSLSVPPAISHAPKAMISRQIAIATAKASNEQTKRRNRKLFFTIGLAIGVIAVIAIY